MNVTANDNKLSQDAEKQAIDYLREVQFAAHHHGQHDLSGALSDIINKKALKKEKIEDAMKQVEALFNSMAGDDLVHDGEFQSLYNYGVKLGIPGGMLETALREFIGTRNVYTDENQQMAAEEAERTMLEFGKELNEQHMFWNVKFSKKDKEDKEGVLDKISDGLGNAWSGIKKGWNKVTSYAGAMYDKAANAISDTYHNTMAYLGIEEVREDIAKEKAAQEAAQQKQQEAHTAEVQYTRESLFAEKAYGQPREADIEAQKQAEQEAAAKEKVEENAKEEVAISTAALLKGKGNINS